MISRIYVHNFRCLENFELPLGGGRSILLVGKNGSGKTTVGKALEVLQKIARGTNRVGDLVKRTDLGGGRTEAPIRFAIDVALQGSTYAYSVAFELPKAFRELRVLEERLTVDGNTIFTREIDQIRLARAGQALEAAFRIDWHLVALPIVQEQSADDPLSVFKRWLGNMLVLRPVPSLARGESRQETLWPDPEVSNLGAWFSGMVAAVPSTYSRIKDYLDEILPDFDQIQNPPYGKDTRWLELLFKQGSQKLKLSFEELSDGEKCFIIFALTIAANAAFGPLLCFWDEPDNFLAPAEVGPSLVALRRAFLDEGQLIVASHNPETIRRFSDENTLVLYRNSHMEPTVVRSVEAIRASGEVCGSFVNALIRGDAGR